MCFLTICWGHVGIQAAKLEHPEYPSSSLSLQGPATASRLQARHLTLSASSRTLISSFPTTRPQHTRVACLPQGTQPQDIGVPDPPSRALTLLARAGLCSPAL